MGRWKTIFTIVISLLAISLQGQTSISNGDWESGLSWNSGAGITTTNVGADNQDIIISANDTINVGAYGNSIGLSFMANRDTYSISIGSGSVLTIYGDVTFGNKAMDLNIDGTVIIFGDLTLNNKIDISSSGTLVVTGTFSKSGSASQGSYTGTGKVYAGAYNSTADGFVPGTSEDNSDQQQLLSNLEPDGESDLSDFVYDEGKSPLPVTLRNFTYSMNGEQVVLTWETESEENFDYFEVQRADASLEFKTIGCVKGSGFSKETVKYSWTDKTPLNGSNYYRLAANDFDGYKEQFQAVYVLITGSSASKSIYPNPVPSGGNFKLKAFNNQMVTIKIYNLHGKLEFIFRSSENTFSLPDTLSKGTYILDISNNASTRRERLIIR